MKVMSAEARAQIVTLVVEGRKSPREIATLMGKQLHLNQEVSTQTQAGIVRRIVKTLVPDHVRIPIRNDNSATHLQSVSTLATSKRDEWMRTNGMHVWTPEENDYFQELIALPEMRRTAGRLNHDKISAAMQERFRDPCFTTENCRNHYLYIRHKETALARQQRKRHERSGLTQLLEQAKGN